MNFRVINKDQAAQSDRFGETYELYQQLIELMEQDPGKKAVVEFSSLQTGQRRQRQILDWAHADGYQLFASAISNTNEREMYLEPKA